MPGSRISEDAETSGVTLGQASVLGCARLILKAINAPNASPRVSKKDLPDAIGISSAHVHAILNPVSQGLTRISLDEIGKVVVFARKFAADLAEPEVGNLIRSYCNRIAEHLQEALQRGGLNPTEFAFVTNLKLRDGGRQQEFSDHHAGVHALIRFDRDAHILISRLDIFPREHQICRFATDSGHSQSGEPMVEGHIFVADEVIHAVGRPISGGGLRTSILRPNFLPGADRADLIGLRLGNSRFDGGPYAYRTYVRRIEGVEQVGRLLPAWSQLFRARSFKHVDDIRQLIPDIDTILKLLREPDDPPWGVRIPTGIAFDDDYG